MRTNSRVREFYGHATPAVLNQVGVSGGFLNGAWPEIDYLSLLGEVGLKFALNGLSMPSWSWYFFIMPLKSNRWV